MFIVTLTCGITDTISAPQLVKKAFTLEEIVPLQAKFYPERVTVQWISGKILFMQSSMRIQIQI